jgi:hypothetical protein
MPVPEAKAVHAALDIVEKMRRNMIRKTELALKLKIQESLRTKGSYT